MSPHLSVISELRLVPLSLAGVGVVAGVGLWLVAHSNRKAAVLFRFLAALAGAWALVCLAYVAAAPAAAFRTYLLRSTLATEMLAGFGAVLYIGALVTFEPGDRQWRRSSALLAGITLMGVAFVRAADEPAIGLFIQAPLALLFVATVWRFRAEPLVYLAILSVAVTVIVAARDRLAPFSDTPTTTWITSTASGVSLAMVLAAALLGLKRRQSFNVKWYRQGLLIVPLVVSSVAVMGAGYVAVWHGATGHTVWNLGAWWAVLLVSAVGLRQPDLFGFSSVGAGLAAAAAFAVWGGDEIPGYWGRYPSVLLATAFGAAVLASLLALVRHGPATAGFPRALYLAAIVIAVAALALEPYETEAKYLGVDCLIAAGVLALAHSHRAPAWVNYLVAGLVTAGAGVLSRLGAGAAPAARHHRFIHVAAAIAVAWLVVALLVRKILRHVASDRTARRQTEPFTVFGMVATLVLAGYLGVQQVRAYAEFFVNGQSPTLPLLGPLWGLVGWLAVLLAFLLSMWLLRHTARTFLFYCVGVMATAYAGLFRHTDDLYEYLIYAVAGYGAAHLMVYLYEARFMALLSRISALYRDERRASTTIFTLAVTSCFAGAILTAFRLHSTASLVMLGIMSAVFLAWSFVWLRGEMLYPAVVMVTLGLLAVWHNKAAPMEWSPLRLSINAAVFTFSAVFWLGVGNRVHAIRGEIFQLAGPARACSRILSVVGMGFAAALAFSPAFEGPAWNVSRSLGDWLLGLSTLAALIIYFSWARSIFGRRVDDIMGGAALLVGGLYVGIYLGVQLSGAG